MALTKVSRGLLSTGIVDNSNATAITIDSSENVGIGTSSPSTKLHLGGTAPGDSIIRQDSTGSGTNWEIGEREAGKWQIFEDDSDSVVATFTSTGNLLVGTTSVMAGGGSDGVNGFGVQGSGGGKFAVSQNLSDYNLYCAKNSGHTSNNFIGFFVTGSKIGSIAKSGSGVAYNTSSDYRLKENVVAMSGATERLKQLNPSRFNFIVDADTTVDGFLAHEVQDVVPEAITGTKDAMRDEEYEVTPAVLDDDDNVTTEAVMGTRSVPDYQGIDQSKLVPLLVATIQELEARLTALENN